jgi:hypothetical protein
MTVAEHACRGRHDALTCRARERRSGKSLEPIELTSIGEVHNMATQRVVIPGIVKNGLVVPQNDTPLPEGATSIFSSEQQT